MHYIKRQQTKRNESRKRNSCHAEVGSVAANDHVSLWAFEDENARRRLIKVDRYGTLT